MNLAEYRTNVDKIDKQLIQLLSDRLKISQEIGDFKKANGFQVFDPQREQMLLETVEKIGEEFNLKKNFIRRIWTDIIAQSKAIQQKNAPTDFSTKNYSHFLLETDRIILKSISFDYLEDIFANFTSEITTFMYPKPAEKIQETAEFIHESINANEAKKDIQLVIIHKESGEFLGCCGLHRPHGIDPEFGIWIQKSAFGNGYGLEAIATLKTWADEHLDCDYFIYPVDQKNVASRNIPEKLGGFVHKTYQKMNQSGVTLNMVEYKILRKK